MTGPMVELAAEVNRLRSENELLRAALLPYVTAHEFVLKSEGYEDEEQRCALSRRYNLARAALGRDREQP